MPRKTLLLSIAVLALLSRPAPAAGQTGEETAPPPAPAEPAKRVMYVPETVKAELREEIKKEVMEQAKRERWAAPDAVPDWLRHFKFNGDIRARFERDIFPRGNANQGEFPDFNAINQGKPFDVNFVDVSNERYLNVDQNRTRPRLRARLGADVEMARGFSAGVRLASGESSNPGSENQTLGNSGGNFSKYQVWIDRAFVRYDAPLGESTMLAIRLGRFDNPFFNTEMLWSPDVQLDGALLEARLGQGGAFSPFLIGGALPVYNSIFAFPVEQTSKLVSRNKWLYGAQLGADIRFPGDVRFKLGASFFDFDKVEGASSQPCDTNLSNVSCGSDESRPSFAQKGNTYLAIRTPSAAALQLESSSTVPRYQYFGLASRFRELVGTARLGVPVASLLFELEGEYVNNPGFKRSELENVALNNRGAISAGGVIGPLRAGNSGVLGRFGFGSASQGRFLDWKVRLCYRYLESDAVLDALNDQDFGLGGTNLKGYNVDGSLWVADGVALGARWFSADQIVGPTYSVDVFQLELLARF